MYSNPMAGHHPALLAQLAQMGRLPAMAPHPDPVGHQQGPQGAGWPPQPVQQQQFQGYGDLGGYAPQLAPQMHSQNSGAAPPWPCRSAPEQHDARKSCACRHAHNSGCDSLPAAVTDLRAVLT